MSRIWVSSLIAREAALWAALRPVDRGTLRDAGLRLHRRVDEELLLTVRTEAAHKALGEHGAHSCGYDKFSALHPNTRGWHQVEYAESIGMGSRDYELITV